jgi:hypothetical protein
MQARIAMIDDQLKSAQYTYDTNEKERQELYTSTKQRIVTEMERVKAEYNRDMVLSKYKLAYDYCVKMDKDAKEKNRQTLQGKKRFLKRQKDKLEEQM